MPDLFVVRNVYDPVSLKIYWATSDFEKDFLNT